MGQRACVSTQHTSNLPRGRGVQAASWVTSPAAAASAAAALSSLFLSLSRSRSASPSGCSAWARHQLSVLLAHAVEELCDRSRPCEGVPPRLASAAEDVLRVVRQLQRVVCCAPPATTSKRERERESGTAQAKASSGANGAGRALANGPMLHARCSTTMRITSGGSIAAPPPVHTRRSATVEDAASANERGAWERVRRMW